MSRFTDAIAASQVVPLLEDYAPAGVLIAVVYVQKRYLSVKVKEFVTFMQELMERLKRDRIVE